MSSVTKRITCNNLQYQTRTLKWSLRGWHNSFAQQICAVLISCFNSAEYFSGINYSGLRVDVTIPKFGG